MCSVLIDYHCLFTRCASVYMLCYEYSGLCFCRFLFHFTVVHDVWAGVILCVSTKDMCRVDFFLRIV